METQPLSSDAPGFPPQLLEIHQPPTQLYVRGNLELLKHPLLFAVVGSRKANAYGKASLTQTLLPAIKRGVITVSGLAFGIDALVHRLSVSVGQPTIAVLGSGTDDQSIYPRNHLKLAHEILKNNGLLLSEHPNGTKARPFHFPERNRIVAGLCSATLIVQAAKKSGSLITARLAMESNRDVAVIPGPINDPLSYGPNHLLRDGAIPILEPADIYQLLHLTDETTTPLIAPDLSPIQQQVLATLDSQPRHIDEITAAANLTSNQVSIALVELELLELVNHVGNLKYVGLDLNLK
jgi:DNA processing protein